MVIIVLLVPPSPTAMLRLMEALAPLATKVTPLTITMVSTTTLLRIVDHALISSRTVNYVARILPNARNVVPATILTMMVNVNHVMPYFRAVRDAAKVLRHVFHVPRGRTKTLRANVTHV